MSSPTTPSTEPPTAAEFLQAHLSSYCKSHRGMSMAEIEDQIYYELNTYGLRGQTTPRKLLKVMRDMEGCLWEQTSSDINRLSEGAAGLAAAMDALWPLRIQSDKVTVPELSELRQFYDSFTIGAHSWVAAWDSLDRQLQQAETDKGTPITLLTLAKTRKWW